MNNYTNKGWICQVFLKSFFFFHILHKPFTRESDFPFIRPKKGQRGCKKTKTVIDYSWWDSASPDRERSGKGETAMKSTSNLKNLKGSLILSLCALIWGISFAAQTAAAEHLPSFFINGFRSAIGALFLSVFLFIYSKIKKVAIFPKEPSEKKRFLKAGLFCGILLTISVNLQQFGIAAYPAGVASEARGGFLTALYVILVPMFAVFSKKKPSVLVWLAGVVALGGIFLLCFSGNFGGFYLGDVLMIACAFAFTFHIFAIDKFGVGIFGPLLCMMQFFVCSILSFVLSLAFGDFGTITAESFSAGLPYLLYVGIACSGIAYTLQIVGQKFAEPAVASLSMSLESVFAALGGWVLRGSVLSFREVVGCALVFLAILMAQIPELHAQRLKNKNAPEKV